MEKEFRESNSANDTFNIGKELAEQSKPGEVYCLYGDLGTGKTAFVQGLVKALGFLEPISSPTFTVVNCYEGGRLDVYHFDVYRIEDCDEMYEIGYEEYVFGEGVTLIEWSEKIKDILPEERYEITIEKDYDKHEDYRKISIERV